MAYETEASATSQSSCDECGLSCSSAGELEKHLLVHIREKPFQCNFCYLAYANIKDLGEHVRGHANELGADFEECDICKAYWSKEKMEQHKKAHARDTARKAGRDTIACAACDESFKTLSKLYLHTKFHHQDMGGPFACGCKKKFTTLLQLSKHKAIECQPTAEPQRVTRSNAPVQKHEQRNAPVTRRKRVK